MRRSYGENSFPEADSGSFEIYVRAASGTRVEVTEEKIAKVEGFVRQNLHEDLELIISEIGVTSDWSAAYTPNAGPMDTVVKVQLTEHRHHSAQEYVNLLRRGFAGSNEFADLEFAFDSGGMIRGAMNEGKSTPINVRILSKNLEQAHKLAEEIQRKVTQINGVVDARIMQRLDYPEYIIDVNRAKAADLGLDQSDVMRNVVAALNSSIQFNKRNFWIDPVTHNQYFVGVQYPEQKIESIETLLEIPITSPVQNRPIPLKNIVALRRTTVPTEVNHANLQPSIDLTMGGLGPRPGARRRRNHCRTERLRQAGWVWRLAPIRSQRSYEDDHRSEDHAQWRIRRMQDTFRSLSMGLILASLLIYFLMVALDRSWIVPLTVMLVVPLCLVGVLPMLYFTRTALNVQSLLGIIFIVGIKVANTVLMTDFAQELRHAEGLTPIQAIRKAASIRVRPITMTALAAFFAMIPAALALEHGQRSERPAGPRDLGWLARGRARDAVRAALPLRPNGARSQGTPSGARRRTGCRVADRPSRGHASDGACPLDAVRHLQKYLLSLPAEMNGIEHSARDAIQYARTRTSLNVFAAFWIRVTMPRPSPSNAPARHSIATGATGRRHMILAAAALVLVVFAAYAPLWEAGFIWDDDHYVTENPCLRSLDGLREIWFQLGAVPQYYPLVHTTFWIEHRLWGLDPLGYHVTNVALHLAVVFLLWRLLTRLQIPGAYLAAAIVAVHPIEVESIAWIAERKNVLSLVLALSSLLCYLRFAPIGPTEPARRRQAWYLLAALFFVAAMFSKTVVVTLPGVILVIYWWKRGRLTRHDVVPVVPFIVSGAVLASVTVWMEKHHVGTIGSEWSLTPVDRLLVAGRATCFYAFQLFWPQRLTFFYPRWNVDACTWWQYLFPLAVVTVVVALAGARQRIGRGPLAGMLIFVGVLTPCLGFVDVYPFRYSFVADHFQYHAGIALLALAAAGATRGAMLLPLGQQAGRVAASAMVLMLSVMTFLQTLIYHDLDSLYRDTIAKNPECWAAYSNLSRHLHSRGQNGEAIHLARCALVLAPDHSDLHYNLASLLMADGGPQEFPAGTLDVAIAEFREAVRLDAGNVAARTALAFALIEAHQQAEAATLFAAVLDVDPQIRDAHYGLGQMAGMAGDWPGAEAHFRHALQIDPTYADAHHDLALALLNLDRADDAAEQLRQTLCLDPERPLRQRRLGELLLHGDDPAKAIDHFADVVMMWPDRIEPRLTLAQALLASGDADRAVACLQAALTLHPDSDHVRAGLAAALKIQRR